MKICICTTPIRPQPTTFPPFGSLAIIQSLREIGEEAKFFNIDYFRYTEKEIEDYFRLHRFDVVGISAVVSTAYAYVKYLADLIHRISPESIVIVGGNLAASAEIILRKCRVKFCVIGDGELIIRELIAAIRANPLDYALLAQTKGIAYLDPEGRFHFTGYGIKPPAGEIAWPDYDVLEADKSISYYIPEAQDYYIVPQSAKWKGGRAATVIMAKGCVARCTFCHRFEKGYRARPAEQVASHVRFLIDRYNVTFVDISDENFGSDAKTAREIAACLGELGMSWRAAGVRARTVTKESLNFWKANGCTGVFFGIESGSQAILDIMEKGATVQQNVDAIRNTFDAGLGTILQLVLGMPGETDETVSETIGFLKQVSEYLLWADTKLPSDLLSINYAQALPGTPLYEYAREHGYIGSDVDSEEAYLLRISDTDAYRDDHFINYTGQPLLNVLMWRFWIKAEVDADFLVRRTGRGLSLGEIVQYYWNQGIRRARDVARGRGLDASLRQGSDSDYVTESGRFNIEGPGKLKLAPILMNRISAPFFRPLLALAVAAQKALQARNPLVFFTLLADQIYWRIIERGRPRISLPGRSLRKVIGLRQSSPAAAGEDSMVPLRLGR